MKDRQQKYTETLQKMIRLDTVSDPSNASSPENFEQFRALLAELFPSIFSVCEVREFNGSLLMKWKGSDGSTQPVMFMRLPDIRENPVQILMNDPGEIPSLVDVRGFQCPAV